jgi:hypothetical protein
LLILAGHSEIELHGDTLSAIECCGPLRWARQRSTTDLRRFFVSGGLAPLNLLLRWCDDLGVLTPEWKAAVGDHKVRALLLAPGYPRGWLLALGEELARRCAPSGDEITVSETAITAQPAFLPVQALTTSAQPIAPKPPTPGPPRLPVLERDPELSAYEELDERPTGSRIVLDSSADRLTLIVPPPGWRPNVGWFIGGFFVCLFALGFTQSAATGEHGPLSLALMILGALVCWATGIGLGLMGINRTRRCVVLDVAGDTLLVWQSGLWRMRPRKWSRQQLADVFVMHHPGDSESDPYYELHIQPHPGHGRAFTLLAHRDIAELRWVATVLRRSLDCSGDGENSPPPGFVVHSPRLLARFPKQR